MADLRTQTDALAGIAGIAGYVRGLPGVLRAVIASDDGELVAAEGTSGARRDGALASFIASRATDLSAQDGDLRGFGRRLAGSRLQEVVLGGRDGETVILPAGAGWMFIAFAAGGQRPTTIDQARVALRRLQPAAA